MSLSQLMFGKGSLFLQEKQEKKRNNGMMEIRNGEGGGYEI